jgi:hypothetical protein
MDDAGQAIASDTISAPKGIKANTLLELGFELEDCAAIKKWQVKIVER